MSQTLRVLLTPIILTALAATLQAKPPALTDPAKAGADFQVQGEYVGKMQPGENEDKIKLGVQVVALGDGKFHAVGYEGGLPGAGWDGSEKHEADGKTTDGVTVFEEADAKIKDGVLTLTNGKGGAVIGTLKKIVRKSPTLGAKPPKGAVILFDGKTPDNFEGGRMTPDGLLMEGVTSKQKFKDFTIHLEFRTPFMPKSRGQGRGNSGFYAQGRYEVQILDSFGLEGKDNECGGIYKVGPPKVNMCFPPLSWQTYDVDVTSAVYEDGKKVKNARMTVRHNGEVIHKGIEIPNVTFGGPAPEDEAPGPVFLQNHGNPVRFRNIWVVEKK
jgi:hypothetical protein